jgi:hypothetical protein
MLKPFAYEEIIAIPLYTPRLVGNRSASDICAQPNSAGHFLGWRCVQWVSATNRPLQYISPPLDSYRFLDITYRLRPTDITNFISDIGSTDI